MAAVTARGSTTVRQALGDARRELAASPLLEHYPGQERIDAADLLDHVLGRTPAPSETLAPRYVERFEALVGRRAAGEPVAMIRGWEEYRGLRITIRPGVFVPRDSTTFLAEQAIRRLRPRRDPVAIDVATGSGIVALAIANEVPKARVFGTDISAEAVRAARSNARRLRLGARFAVADGLGGVPPALEGSVDVITLHPPYVPSAELTELAPEMLLFEPRHTHTDGSEDGLGLVRSTVERSRTWLKPGGWLCIEVSPDVTRALATAMRRGGLGHVAVTTDSRSAGTRVVVGRR
jgi:release factor glutamine methyltransferase